MTKLLQISDSILNYLQRTHSSPAQAFLGRLKPKQVKIEGNKLIVEEPSTEAERNTFLEVTFNYGNMTCR